MAQTIRVFKPLEMEKVDWLKGLMSAKTFTQTDLAKKIGIPRSTLKDAVSGGNVTKKTWGRINEFLAAHSRQPSTHQGGPQLRINIPMPKITGDEKPKIGREELQRLLVRFEIGADLLIPILARLANGDIGTRKAFHSSHGNGRFQDLHTLVRALSSETMLLVVRKEVGKEKLP